MTAAAHYLVDTPVPRNTQNIPAPAREVRPPYRDDRLHRGPSGSAGIHPVHRPVIALLLHLLTPGTGAGDRSEELIADLHRAVEVAVTRDETADEVGGAVRGAIEATVAELRGAGISAPQIASYARRLGRIHEFIATTATSAYRRAARRAEQLPADPGHGRADAADQEIVAVVALAFCRAPGTSETSMRRLPGVPIETCLTRESDARAISPLTEHGGTLAIGTATDIDSTVARIVSSLSRALRADISATVLRRPASRIEESVDEAHEMLDVVRRLGYPHGIYPFEQIALEYQVTRPGPARESLARIAAALDGHPDLIDALVLYIRCRGSRKSTARMLHVHPNTVDYRFRRIHQVTGYDPASVSGLSKLQAALVVGAYTDGRYPGPAASLPVTGSLARTAGTTGRKAV
ncbi:PucR family transcriptional regulator [Nocardia sp. NPDC003963]